MINIKLCNFKGKDGLKFEHDDRVISINNK